MTSRLRWRSQTAIDKLPPVTSDMGLSRDENLRAGMPGGSEPETARCGPDLDGQPAAEADVRVLSAGRDGPGADDRAAGRIRCACRCHPEPGLGQRRA